MKGDGLVHHEPDPVLVNSDSTAALAHETTARFKPEANTVLVNHDPTTAMVNHEPETALVNLLASFAQSADIRKEIDMNAEIEAQKRIHLIRNLKLQMKVCIFSNIFFFARFILHNNT